MSVIAHISFFFIKKLGLDNLRFFHHWLQNEQIEYKLIKTNTFQIK